MPNETQDALRQIMVEMASMKSDMRALADLGQRNTTLLEKTVDQLQQEVRRLDDQVRELQAKAHKAEGSVSMLWKLVSGLGLSTVCSIIFFLGKPH